MKIQAKFIENCSTPEYARRWCEVAMKCCEGPKPLPKVEVQNVFVDADDAPIKLVVNGTEVAVFL